MTTNILELIHSSLDSVEADIILFLCEVPELPEPLKSDWVYETMLLGHAKDFMQRSKRMERIRREPREYLNRPFSSASMLAHLFEDQAENIPCRVVKLNQTKEKTTLKHAEHNIFNAANAISFFNSFIDNLRLGNVTDLIALSEAVEFSRTNTILLTGGFYNKPHNQAQSEGGKAKAENRKIEKQQILELWHTEFFPLDYYQKNDAEKDFACAEATMKIFNKIKALTGEKPRHISSTIQTILRENPKAQG